jgi:hypothetical protein
VTSEHQDAMRIDNVVLNYDVPRRDMPAIMARAHDRLEAAGWQVGSFRTDGYQGFEGSAGELDFSLFSSGGGSDGSYALTVYVRKSVSAFLLACVIAAGVVGFLAGWMVGVSSVHRYRRHHPVRRSRVNTAATLFCISATYITAMTFMFVTSDFADGIDAADIQAPLAFMTFPGIGPLITIVSATCGLAALVLNAPARPAAPPRPEPPYPTSPSPDTNTAIPIPP